MFSSKNQFLTGAGGYKIQRSVRLRSSASAYFNRTPASAGNRKTFTFSFWIKLGDLGTGIHEFFNSYDLGNNEFSIDYRSNSLYFYSYQTTIQLGLTTTAVFRDPSAWYHIVVQADTTQAIASDRAKIWVNGVLQAITSPTYPALNADLYWNVSGKSARIGGRENNSAYFDGYITEINFIDGQALTASSFGQTNPVTGVWQPIKYTGTYGTNGFYLNFSDNSAATAAAIGKDYSGNGNNWTPNNISVTAGTTYDSMLDSPTLYADGGNGRGNYCTLNPISATFGSTITVINGNLTWNKPSSTIDWRGYGSMQLPKTGQWYWEVTLTSGAPIGGSGYGYLGIADTTFGTSGFGTYFANGYFYLGNGNKATAGNSSGVAYGSAYNTNGIVIGIAYDASAGTITFYNNNTSQGTAYSSISTTTDWYPAFSLTGNPSTAVLDVNFGQRPFSYSPPTGFVALNTQNLPTPAISNGANYMAATTYTGTGATASISNAVNSLSFQPDFVWIKTRSTVSSNILFDSLRGTLNYVTSNSNGAAATLAGSLTSFNSNGFSLGTDSNTNGSGTTFVGWQWNAGGSTVTNTSGTISAQVRANATAGFSIATYTGTGANATVGHGLGVAPKMIIVKKRSAIQSWSVYHASLANTQYLVLDTTAGAATLATMWNSTTPTSSVFSVGTDGNVNTSTATYVAYCFSEVAGYSRIGSYTGNGSADGPFVYCGFRPRFIMYKRTDAAGSAWYILDSTRGAYNANTPVLYPNLTNAEGNFSSAQGPDFLSNGFKVHDTAADTNLNGATYIFMAFAENPFKNSLAR
jgi:hypothetical protein